MRLHEAGRPGDDHRADRLRPHDVGIVVNLDPSQWALQTESFG